MIFIDIKATGKNIKTLMDKNNISVSNMAESCGLSTKQAVYKWIWGAALPTLDNLVIIAKLFNCRMDDIIIINED